MAPMRPEPRLPRILLVASFLRSFAIQGSWNYRSMIGGGFAFALLPILRWLARGREEPLDVAVRRHVERFNAHPYLAEVALGAVARMEADGEDPAVIRRFKHAIGGPLGGLGDSLVWATWLPVTLLVALVMGWAGVAPAVIVMTFLVVYNTGHLGLRLWGFRSGWSAGREVGALLRGARLGRLTDRLGKCGALLLGVLVGLLLVGEPGFTEPSWFWRPMAVVALVVGVVGKQRVWRPSALAVVVVIAALTSLQALR